MKSVFLIILHFNGVKDTLECLKSTEKLQVTSYKLQVVVVDNGSKEKLKVESGKWKIDVKVIRNEENLGFAGGNNAGIRYALANGANYIMVLNNDTLVDKQLLVSLVEVFSQHPAAGILSPKIYFAPNFEYHRDRYKASERGKVIWYAGGIIDWDNVLASHRGVDEIDSGQHDSIQETDYSSGACMLVKSEVFKKTGLFDEDYFLYWEDADLSERAKRAGYKVLYAPTAHLWHKNAGSSHVGGSLHDYYLTRNRLLFGSKYASARTRFALVRESFIRLVFTKRPWQRQAIIDFYLKRFGRGSYPA